jgi:hypothetical protein
VTRCWVWLATLACRRLGMTVTLYMADGQPVAILAAQARLWAQPSGQVLVFPREEIQH